MHMWDCINYSGFGVADQRRQFVTFQFQITHLFSTTEANSSHIIVQIFILSVGNHPKWESSRKIFHSLPVLHITFKTRSATLPPNIQIYNLTSKSKLQ